jgi:PAS domain S-box-containing protein
MLQSSPSITGGSKKNNNRQDTLTRIKHVTSSAKLSKPRILIIDDSLENLTLMRIQLERADFEILLAENGMKGIEIARSEQPDLILLDIMMPVMSGFEVCQRIKDDPVTADIKVIIVTTLSDTAHRIRGIRAGADEFISRPYHAEELLIRMRSLIQLKQARETLQAEHEMLQLLYNVGQAITSQIDLQQMMIDIIVTTKAALGATTGNIMLLDDTAQVSHKILVRDNVSGKVSDHVSHEVMSQGFAGWLVREAQGAIIADAEHDPRWIVLDNDKDDVGAAIGVPLKTPNQLVGLLILTHPQPGFFHEDHLQLLDAVGRQVTAAIQNARLFTKNDEQRRKMEAILDQSSDAIITIDEQFEVVLLNRAAENVFDVDPTDVIGRNIHDCQALDTTAHLFEMAKESAISAEIATANDVTMYGTFSPVPGIGYMAVLQDISQIKQAEAQRLAAERREKEHVKETLTRYVSPILIDDVLSEAAGVIESRSRQLAVVLFADLRNSTELVSQMPPDQAIDLLNEFFDSMIEVVYQFEGTVFDLIGDELEIAFNVPLAQADAVERALQTALAMQKHFQLKLYSWYERSGVVLGLGIGIDMGEVVVGNVGAASRMHYAMVGRAVNLAHNLVDLAEDGEIVVSESVCEKLHLQASHLLTELGTPQLENHRLKGHADKQPVYRFLQPDLQGSSGQRLKADASGARRRGADRD